MSISSSEDEIGQDVDRLVRSALMAAGQIREHAARRQQTNAWTHQQQMGAAVAEHREHTQLVYDRVRREEFWQQATPGQVADLATFTSAIAPHDARGREAHDVIREQLRSRSDVDVDAITAAHSDPADRRNALVHALEDRQAAQREDAEAREDLTRADQLKDRAAQASAGGHDASSSDGSSRDESRNGGSRQDEAEHDLAGAEDAREDAEDHLAAHDRLLDAAAATTRVATTTGEQTGEQAGEQATDAEQTTQAPDRDLAVTAPVAAQAHREASTTFPQSANTALRASPGAPGPRPAAGTHRPRERTPELTR